MKLFSKLALVLLAASLPVGAVELDPEQQSWFDFYQKQKTIPNPEAMLLNTDPEPELSEGFVPLFNGKDLSGWTVYGGESKFEVRNGKIVSTCTPGQPSTYLSTNKQDYADFILTAEANIKVDVNSGIMFRAHLAGPNNDVVSGPQCEYEPYPMNRGWTGGVYGQSVGGWFYPLWLQEHAAARAAQTEGWNRLTIQAVGDTIKTWVNGVPVAHWKTDEYLKGFIGLQMHKARKGRVVWRDVRIKEL